MELNNTWPAHKDNHYHNIATNTWESEAYKETLRTK